MEASVGGLKLQGDEDRLFAAPGYPNPFQFDRDVAAVFDNMIARSVPLYEEVQTMVVRASAGRHRPGGHIVDVGCSTGTTIWSLAQALDAPATFWALDPSAAMLEQARHKLGDIPSQHKVRFVEGTAADFEFPATCEATILNYTLQFILPRERPHLLRRIAQGLQPGGWLFLADKVVSGDAELESLQKSSYERFKESRGYSRSEIERKRAALDQVLIPLTLDENIKLLREAGFSQVELVFKWHSFISLIAVRGDSV